MWEKGAFREPLNVIVSNDTRTHSKSDAKLLYFFSLRKTRIKIFILIAGYNFSTGLSQSPVFDDHINDYGSTYQRCDCAQRQQATLARQLAHNIAQKGHCSTKHYG